MGGDTVIVSRDVYFDERPTSTAPVESIMANPDIQGQSKTNPAPPGGSPTTMQAGGSTPAATNPTLVKCKPGGA
jgi:hypothetical protein